MTLAERMNVGASTATSFRFHHHGLQIAREVVPQPFFDQCDWHTNTALNREFVNEGATISKLIHPPSAFKTTKVSLHHLETEQTFGPEFGEFELHLR